MPRQAPLDAPGAQHHIMIPGIERRKIFLNDRDRAVKELGISLRELARRLEISPPAVGYCVERGEAIALKNNYRLIE